MNDTVIYNGTFRADRESLAREMRAGGNPAREAELMRLADEAEAVGKPRALYREARVDLIEGDSVYMEGVGFSGRVIAVNLAGADSAYPFIATCGAELDLWSRNFDDMLYRYWAGAIKTQALDQALGWVNSRIHRKGEKGERSMMNPGSLPGWPIEEQRPLFRLLGGDAEKIGVRLTGGLSMDPDMSLSGIIFFSDRAFVNCALCDREDCAGRRVPCDFDLRRHYGE